MRRKVAWVFIGMNLALWLGGCDSGNRAARIDESQTPLFEEGYPTQPETPATALTAAPSLQGFDRSHWETYYFIPPRGVAPHGQLYFTSGFFSDEPLYNDRRSPLRSDGDLEGSTPVTDAGDREPLGVRRFYLLPLESVDFAADLVTTPIRAVIGPRPWDRAYSPRE